uniref:Carbamoyl-phosphate synthase large subunit n=1 Tax=Candidatus Kentrum sp. DK TaxID=2126562 RepID=A0A450TE00_9GAMM|nr:MAG: carbamoyl-phosphate synthase large subunit [Candidatus Kentron sp. DK]
MKKLLITSVGSLVGQNVLDTLEGRRENLRIIGTNSVAEAAGNFRCDSSFLVASAAERQRFVADLVRIISDEKPDVIVPGRDADIEILARIRETDFPESTAFLCGSPEFAAIMDDKVRSYTFAEAYQLPFARSCETGQADSLAEAQKLVAEYGYPLIAKPKAGNGSRGIWVVTNEAQLERSSALIGYAMQPLLGHDEPIEMQTEYGIPFVWEVPENALYAAQVLIGKNGEILGKIAFVSRMVMGKCEQITHVEDPKLMQVVMRFAEQAIAAGWIGPLNLQFKKDSTRGFQAIEMNGRFSGGTSARLYLGYDEVQLLLNHWIGENIIPASALEGISRTVTKSLCDFPIRPKDVATLSTTGQWSRSESTSS